MTGSSASASKMATSNGREKAIESLIDMDPNGPVIRAVSISKEANRAALQSRPNFISTAGFREVAHSLSDYTLSNQESDQSISITSPSYRSPSSEIPPLLDKETREQLFSHHSKIIGAISENNVDGNKITHSQLISHFKQVWKDENMDADVFVKVMKQSIFSFLKQPPLLKDYQVDETLSALPSLEKLMGDIISQHLTHPSLNALLACVLLTYLCCYCGERDSGSSTNSTTLVQVGGIVSLLSSDGESVGENSGKIGMISKETLEHFKNKVLSYEQKIRKEMLDKKRREEEEEKKRIEDELKSKRDEFGESKEKLCDEDKNTDGKNSSVLSEGSSVEERLISNIINESTEEPLPVISTPATEQNTQEVPRISTTLEHSPLQPNSLREHLLLAETVSLSEEDNNNDMDHNTNLNLDDSDVDRIRIEETVNPSNNMNRDQEQSRNLSSSSSSFSSSSSSSGSSSSQRNTAQMQSGGEEVMLQQALALSLGDTAGFETPSNQTPLSSKKSESIRPEESSDCEGDELSPVLFSPKYPYLSLLEGFTGNEKGVSLPSEEDSKEIIQPSEKLFFDPSEFGHFGGLPGQVVMVHFLHLANNFMHPSTREKDLEKDESTISDSNWTPSAPGGVGSDLFSKSESSDANTRSSKKSHSVKASLLSSTSLDEDRVTSCHVLSSLMILMTNSRKEILSALSQIPAPIKIPKNNDSEDNPKVDDDPAILHGQTNISTSNEEACSSNAATALQEKGFRRKAAAAADAAAARLKLREKRRSELQHQLDVFTESLEIVLKLLKSQLTHSCVSSLNLNYGKSLMDNLLQLTEHVIPSSGSMNLCVLSIQLYAEVFPIIFKEDTTRQNFLHDLIKEDSNAIPIEKCVTSPTWTIDQVKKGKLDAICQRARQADIVDSFLSAPLLSTLNSVAVTQKSESNLTNLYLALSHRMSKKAILFSTLGNDEIICGVNSMKSMSNSISLQVSSSLQFDPAKCADSIAILPSKTSVHQRASKAWGTVLSTSSFSPKTGVHRWAVRLDKCEKGHVFVGIATAQAGTRTYVGGDRFGWGVIGTQALWHHRSKIRGDYGSTFRTGSTIIVTLDTNVGTVSFGLLSESSNSASSQSVSSSLFSFDHNGSANSTSFVDWGVAFEGLPLDAKLYPAVGLYQRDDKVTVLSIGRQKESKGASGFSGDAPCGSLVQSGISHTLDVLHITREMLKKGQSLNPVLEKLVPSIAANLCLLPYNDMPRWVCGKYAMQVLPLLTEVAQLFPESCVKYFQEGEWLIRASSEDGSESLNNTIEEYTLQLSLDETNRISGKGKGESGRSKGNIVHINGSLNGTSLKFVEDWSDESDPHEKRGSSCVVQARMSLDGNRFEGVYWHLVYGTSSKIAGVKLRSTNSQKLPVKKILYSACAHLSSAFCANPVALDCNEGVASETNIEWKKSKLLSPGLRICEKDLTNIVSELKEVYDVKTISGEEAISHAWISSAWRNMKVFHSQEVPVSIIPEVMDNWVCPHAGGNGSLTKLGPLHFSTAKRRLLAALLFHTQTYDATLSQFMSKAAPSEEAISLWRMARTTVESVIRKFMSKYGPTKGCRIACEEISVVSQFLTRIKKPCDEVGDVLEFVRMYTSDDVSSIEKEMEISTRKACLRVLGLGSLRNILDISKSDFTRESCLVCIASLLSEKRIHSSGEIEASYLFDLECSGIDDCVQREIHLIYENLCKNLGCEMSDSCLLTTLTCLNMTLQKGDFAMVSSVNVLSSLSKIVKDFRKYLNDPPVGTDVSLSLSGDYHIRRRIFNSAFCSIQLLIAQMCSHEDVDLSLKKDFFSFILEEYLCTRDILKAKLEEEVQKKNDKLVHSEIEQWSKTCLSGKKVLIKSEDEDNSSFGKGIEYLQQNGEVNVASASTKGSSDIEKVGHAFQTPDDYSVGLLNVFFIMVHSHSMKQFLSQNECLSHLLETVEDMCVPSAPRVLRLLRIVLLDIPVKEDILRRIIILAGDKTLHRDESLAVKCNNDSRSELTTIMKESVSLLRYLYAKCKSTRSAINNVMCNYFHEDWNENDEIASGCVSFLGGIIDTICVGSHVLFKPVTTNEKSSSHQSVGGGIESIVSGLSRKNAFAGVISSMDSSNNTCEVVLVEREEGDGHNEGIEKEPNSQAMMVRTTRVSVYDVVSAEELPLIVQNEMVDVIKNMLQTALQRVLQFVNKISLNETEEEKQDENYNISLHVKVLRCAMLVLSDKGALNEFCSSSTSTILSQLLEVASSKSKILSKENLTSLRMHESRSYKLCMQEEEILRRNHLMKCSPFPELDLSSILKSNLNLDRPDNSLPTSSSSGVAGGINTDDGNESVSTADTNSANAANASASDNNANASSSNDDEDAHLREAAIAQMAELGLPRSWSELALLRTGGNNVEAAVHFCLERGGEMEHLLAEERERNRSGGVSSRRGVSSSDILIQQLLEMGFPDHWCRQALEASRNNVDDALTWILTNSERLSGLDAEEEQDDDDDDDEDDDDDQDYDMEIDDLDDDDDEDEDEADEARPGVSNGENEPETKTTTGTDSSKPHTAKKKLKKEKSESSVTTADSFWTGSICPLRFVSGRSSIDPKTFAIEGLSSGGFSSVGVKGVLLTSGKWYYEAELLTVGCLQIGWADGSFAGHCQAEKGDGCGDGPSSWAFDGWRRYKWHGIATEWGCRWQVGDVVGCMVDLDNNIVSFTLNGQGEEIGMGTAFSGEGFRPCGGVYACVSFNLDVKLKIRLNNFKYDPPPGYESVGTAVHNAVAERDLLVKEESILDDLEEKKQEENQRFLCDFSDGEHGHELFAWQHRYYGSDASVHLGSGKSSSRKSAKSKGEKVDNIESTLVKSWEKIGEFEISDENSNIQEKDIRLHIEKGYNDSLITVHSELKKELVCLSILYAQKLLLQFVSTLSSDFSLSLFKSNSISEFECAKRFWYLCERCCSLRSAGWVGEAGAMAIAAEALGLGISTHESSSSSSSRFSHNSETQGLTQVLTSVMMLKSDSERETWKNVAACAEASFGGDSGGSLVFLRDGLMKAASNSKHFRDILVATVRRSVRLLAVVEYSKEDSISSDSDENDENTSENTELDDDMEAPDVRIASFLTGLLLSPSVPLNSDDAKCIASSLFEAWSVGLLSGSAPWRMICAMTATGILNMNPNALSECVGRLPTLHSYFRRIESTVARRIWAERAAVPVCSRYVQAFIELTSAVKKTSWYQIHGNSISVDAATPLPLPHNESCNWEWDEGWITSDNGYHLFSGVVECMAVEWKTPSRSHTRTLMDGGDGPPMLRPGCYVLRGNDWDSGNDDGKDDYDKEKEKWEMEKKKIQESTQDAESKEEDLNVSEIVKETDGNDPVVTPAQGTPAKKTEPLSKEKKVKKPPVPKLPLGEVIGIESWKGVPAVARRVRWNLTGEEGIYRFGGDGGKFDIVHVEVNEKLSKVKKRYPAPESAEQCAARHGFGLAKKFNVLLRIKSNGQWNENDEEMVKEGILEYPDFGAGIKVDCVFYSDGAISVTEKELLYGSKDCGWEPRFGQPSYVSGNVMVLSPTGSSNSDEFTCNTSDTGSGSLLAHYGYEELLGSSSFLVKHLKNPSGGENLRVTSEMRLYRDKNYPFTKNPKAVSIAPKSPPILFDKDYHASSIALSRDGRTVSCVSPDGRGTAFGSVGFTKGVHYWEVKLEHADNGSVFIGVAEKPNQRSSSSSSNSFFERSRLDRWLGWGFVNFRATYTAGAERVYGAHCHNTDTVGVLLNCDAGRISFFFDGVKYGEHILNDLGCAFENLSPFGFNADGCGSGGSGQGAPSGVEGGRSGRYPSNGAVRPRTLWPVIGLKSLGDKVTFGGKWMTSLGVDGSSVLRNVLKVDDVMRYYEATSSATDNIPVSLPDWFVKESYEEYNRWLASRYLRSTTRGAGPYPLTNFGLDVDIDTSPIACASACASLGLPVALLSGDKVTVKRSAGRLLELPEEARVLGACQGRLFYEIISQKSEGGSLTEGGGRAWYWDESEVVDNGVVLIGEGLGLGVELPLLQKFKCSHKNGLKVVFNNGAVVRSDLEIMDVSVTIGSIPKGTIIPQKDVLERRVNSCGVVRYRIKYDPLGGGWISSRILGGKEESIILPVSEEEAIEKQSVSSESFDPEFIAPDEAASFWFKNYTKEKEKRSESSFVYQSYENSKWKISSLQEFEKLLSSARIPDIKQSEFDSLLATAVSSVTDYAIQSDPIDCSFTDIAPSILFALNHHQGTNDVDLKMPEGIPCANNAASKIFSSLKQTELPTPKGIFARIAMLKAFNRRARFALPWMSVRSAQEGSAVLGGSLGYGASVERAGRSGCGENELEWFQSRSMPTRIRSCRNILFTSVKRTLFESIMDVTTFSTPLSHDEYELPREIRTVRINRLKARRAMASSDQITKRKHCVFAQLQHEMRGWSGVALRRGHVAKGHGGQKRAFKVKLVGEGVNDYSGPYREVFADAFGEVKEVDSDSGKSSLGILEPSPNNASSIGEQRDLYVFGNACDDSETYFVGLTKEEKKILKAFSSMLGSSEESIREREDALVFLGRLTATACRHSIAVDLSLPLMSVWRKMAEEKVNEVRALKELDLLGGRQFVERGEILSPLLVSQQRMLNSYVEGMSSVIPTEIFSIFSGEEIRDIICGNPEVDVELLRRVVEYEGYEESDPIIIYLWEVLREMDNQERKLFIQFVWARSRLPMKESDFDAPFKIQKDVKASRNCMDALPSASTCFFSLTLPDYPSKEILRSKLMFAIKNVTTMESDYVTNDAEVSEGWRGI